MCILRLGNGNGGGRYWLLTYPFFWVKSKSIVEGTGFSYSSATSILVFSFINFFLKKKYPKKISSWSSQTLLFHIQIQFIASTSIKLSFHFSGYLTFGFYLAINFFFFFFLSHFLQIDHFVYYCFFVHYLQLILLPRLLLGLKANFLVISMKPLKSSRMLARLIALL